nr:PolC-type DNA polymerase III [Garciella nitratireducens]
MKKLFFILHYKYLHVLKKKILLKNYQRYQEFFLLRRCINKEEIILTDKYIQFLNELKTEEQFSFINKCRIQKVKVNRKLKSWEIIIESSCKIKKNMIEQLEQKILLGFSFLSNITISFYQPKCFKKYENIQIWYSVEGEQLFSWVKRHFPTIITFIPFKFWYIQDDKLIIPVTSKIILEAIKQKNLSSLIHKKISEKINQPFYIDFILKEEIKNNKNFENLKKEELKKIVELTINDKMQTKSIKRKTRKISGKDTVIKGNPIKEESISIKDISIEIGTVVVQGEIFNIDFRLFKNNKTGMIIFNITDLSDSITIKTFEKKSELKCIRDLITKSSYVKVKGEVQFDKYSREIVIIAKDIQRIEMTQRIDTHQEKRVELHAHTQFSAMDGVVNVKKMISTAAKWNHKAIAITDHGVLQAFPDAMNAAKKNNIKIIYGVEGYLTDDESVISGNGTGDFEQTFIVFDIETTGLSPEKNQITEIGAVKIEKGQIVDRFNTLVNPECPIPSNISELTGITEKMVKNAPKIDEIMPTFLEFCGDGVLVAHNAKFDVSFIKNKAKKLKIQIKNPIIDTLAFSRMCLPKLKKHRLNDLAKYFDVSLENHHRAVDDAEATAEIFLKLLEISRKKGAKEINDLNFIFRNKEAIKKMDTYHIILLVKNQIGLKNLYKIVSKSHLDYFYKKPRIPKSLLKEYREGLIVGSACEAGELYQAILNQAEEKYIDHIVSFYDYLEIQPIENNYFLIEKGVVESKEELMDINQYIVTLGEKHKKPVVATCDVHFLNPEDEVYRRILMYGQGFQDADQQPPLYFRTTDEMLKEFEYLGKEKSVEVVITNTNYIADQIQDILPIPDGTFPPKIEGAEEEIYNMAINKAHKIYGDPLPEIIQNRLDKELNSIINNGYAVLYLIAHKLVKKSLSDGYLVGSRGSVGSSLVATFTDITEVNPLPPHYVCPKCKHSEFFDSNDVGVGPDLPDKKCTVCHTQYKKDGFDIPFEVFLGFEGDKEPDIDLNFSGDYQPIAHKYTEELFGEGHTFRAGTIGTIAEKTAYGFVKNYIDEHNMILRNAEINRLVKGCTGVKRTTGQHPGGIMVVPKDKEIYDFCPIQRPADDQNTDIITTHFDYHSISGRLLKLDILGHDDPTVIRMLEDLTGIDATKIPLDDKATMSLFTGTKVLNVEPEDIHSKVGTLGIPEFGTRFVRQMLEDTKPTAFADLLRISGLSHGTDVWLNNAQELIKNEICTIKEVNSTRDDIMIYLLHKGLKPKRAFKIMESVRKGKGLTEEDEKEMIENNVPQWYIDSCKKIKYMFPKAHAAAYVMMAFRIAYFKVHYPLAFYATYFTVRTDDFDAALITKGKKTIEEKIQEIDSKGSEATAKEKGLLTVLEISLEMYYRGYEVLPVSLYESHAEKFIIKDNALLAPFNALPGLGKKAAYNIMQARECGKFISKEDLCERCKIGKSILEILEQHGCLKDLPESNQLCLF